jgi:hypothetical protein
MTPPKPVHKPLNAYRMTATLKNFAYKLTSSLSSSEVPTLKKDGEFSKARKTEDLFPTTDPTTDGDDCLHDCATCTIKYPRKFEIDETEELYGHVKGWQTHLIVATGKTDWVRDVADEKGSIMEAVDKGSVKPSNGVSDTLRAQRGDRCTANELTEANVVCLRHAYTRSLRHQLDGVVAAVVAIHRQRHTCKRA